MNDNLETARRLASRLFSVENAIDKALADAASLQISLIEARQERRQPCGTIQGALDDAVAASAALMEARRAMVGAHGKMEKIRDDFGLDPTAVGCTLKGHADPGEDMPQLKAV
jgi:uncharacterized membrane protein